MELSITYLVYFFIWNTSSQSAHTCSILVHSINFIFNYWNSEFRVRNILGCQDIAYGIFPPLALWKILLFGAPNFEGL